MTEQNEEISKHLKDIQHIRDFLKSEMTLNDTVEGEVISTIKVRNGAPESTDGGDIVFLGVGLRIIDGKWAARGSNYWPSKIKKSRPSDRMEVRHIYNEGTWFGGSGGSFPEATSDERGDVLFPGESVVYEIKTPWEQIPYLDIRVEGSVSRRHLLHISQPLEALKALTQPLVVDTFRSLNAIDYNPLVSIAAIIPSWGPQTTIAEINAFTVAVKNAKDHVTKVALELNKIYHSAPNQKLCDFMKTGIGQYLSTATKLCDKTLVALSGSDTEKMKAASEEMKIHLLKAEELKRGQVDLMSKFGIVL